MLDNIPQELRGYNQWIVWRYEDRQFEKLTKVPYDPTTGLPASVENPSQWSSFEFARAVFERGGYSGLGFVLTERDPFAFVDLDMSQDQDTINRQIEIYNAFNSYSERSPSGMGCHVIVKGHVAKGRRRSSIELYSSLRYMTMTGDVVNHAPIVERQDLLTILWHEMGRGRDNNNNATIYETPQTEADNVVINRALSAANGAKFGALLKGEWQSLYGSQSEADFAFIDMVAFYTQNSEQIVRVFRASALGQRPKAMRNDYVNSMVVRAYDKMLPPINFDQLKRDMAARFGSGSVPPTGEASNPMAGPFGVLTADGVSGQLSAAMQEVKDGGSSVNPYTVPPGLMGDIARFIYNHAQRPVEEIALVGAIGLMAGICGRAYNTPTKAGLNLYTLLLAQSGTGKEAISSGISKLVSSCATLAPHDPEKKSTPSIVEFIGPSEIRSDAALLKHLAKQPCMVSIIGEFGLKLQAMCSIHANSHMTGLRSVMLDLFGKSGKGNMLGQTIYSDKEKNTIALHSPAFSIVAESTPSSYYPALSEDLIEQGLLPRFLVVEYYGKRVPANENIIDIPDTSLINGISALAAGAHSLMHDGRVINCEFEANAWQAAQVYNDYADRQINATNRTAIRDLWNRAHIKALKLSCLVAVGVNDKYPTVTLEHWKWAELIVTTDILNAVGRFERGETGRDSEENKQAVEIMRVCADWVKLPWHEVDKYAPGPRKMHEDRIIPYKYIQARLVAAAVFRKDKFGATNAIKRTIQTMLDNGDLQELDKRQIHAAYGITRRGFTLT